MSVVLSLLFHYIFGFHLRMRSFLCLQKELLETDETMNAINECLLVKKTNTLNRVEMFRNLNIAVN